MHMEIPDHVKGSTSSPPSTFPSAPPQDGGNFDYPPDGGNFDYPPQPPPTMGIPVMHNFSHHQSPIPWSTGLCDCFDDPTNCCLTCWCPCVTFGLIAEITDKGTTSCGMSGTLYALIMFVTGCSFLYSCFYRSKLRSQYFLEGSPCPDCCVHFWCEGCALCQEYRELKNRGFDMSIGWHGNMERLERQMRGTPVTPPMVQQPMMYR